MSSNIFLECETERDEAGMEENEIDAERYEYERDTERDRSPCYEEARVERNVRDFVDEDVDLFATPCRNAKTRALEMIKEENDQQFSRLRDYRVELL
ncbi:hypothetical protein IGI04_036301, partial [Brassica rapa subsp. trilocularis]